MTFFAPPRRVETEVFTRLPDRFRRPRRTAWSDANRAGREVDSFLEGPAFDRQGRLYVTDIPFGRVFRVSPAGEWEQVVEYDGWPDRKSTRLNSSHANISYAVFCLKKKKKRNYVLW